jgi:hypothetical protein
MGRAIEGRRAGTSDSWIAYASQSDAARKLKLDQGSISRSIRDGTEYGDLEFRWADGTADNAEDEEPAPKRKSKAKAAAQPSEPTEPVLKKWVTDLVWSQAEVVAAGGAVAGSVVDSESDSAGGSVGGEEEGGAGGGQDTRMMKFAVSYCRSTKLFRGEWYDQYSLPNNLLAARWLRGYTHVHDLVMPGPLEPTVSAPRAPDSPIAVVSAR